MATDDLVLTAMKIRAWMTTSECASTLGVSTDYIRGEIRDGRLDAQVIPREPRPGRTRGYRAIRVYPEPWEDYLRRYWPECSTFHGSRQSR